MTRAGSVAESNSYQLNIRINISCFLYYLNELFVLLGYLPGFQLSKHLASHIVHF